MVGMPDICVRPNLTVLAWAARRSSDDLRSKFKQLDGWLAGDVQPTLRQLEEFARAVNIPFGYFFLERCPEDYLPVPYFRTSADTVEYPSRFLLEALYTMQRRQAWVRDYLIESGQQPLVFVGSSTWYDDPRNIAKCIGEHLCVESLRTTYNGWEHALRVIQENTERAGIFVVISGTIGNEPQRKLNADEFRGFVLVDEYAPLVFINDSDSKASQMFTLAFALAHIWLGKSAAFDLCKLLPANNETEQLCAQVASELLVPSDQVLEFLARNNFHCAADVIAAIACEFNVSEIIAARRALDIGIISFKDFSDFYEHSVTVDNKRADLEEEGDFCVIMMLRIGRRFAEAVVRAVLEGRLPYREAYQLTGLTKHEFERLKQCVQDDL